MERLIYLLIIYISIYILILVFCRRQRCWMSKNVRKYLNIVDVVVVPDGREPGIISPGASISGTEPRASRRCSTSLQKNRRVGGEGTETATFIIITARFRQLEPAPPSSPLASPSAPRRTVGGFRIFTDRP